MKPQGIDIKLKFTDVTGYTQDVSEPVQEVISDDNRVYYAMKKFIRLYGNSDKTVRRRMEKLDKALKHYSAVRVGNKLFFHKSLYKVGKPDYLSSIYTPTDEDVNGFDVNGDLRVRVDLGQVAPFNEEEYTPVTGATFDNGLVYYEVGLFCQRFGISSSAVYDYIDRIFRERYRYCLTFQGKHYVSPGILFFTKKYIPQLKNLEYAGFLNFYTWTVAASIRYLDGKYHSADRCVSMMKKLTTYLKKEYPNEIHTFFYVTEKNAGEDGYHSHFVYSIQNQNLCVNTLIQRITTFIEKERGKFERQSLIEKFNQTDYFLEYMVKQMHLNPDHYGWMDHNLLV